MDIVGFELNEGLEILKEEHPDMKIHIKKTFSNKESDSNFNVARILRILKSDDKIEIIVGYF